MVSNHDIATVAIHGGRSLDSHASSLLFPLYQTGTFVHDAVGVDKGFSYSRVSNPTVDALERAIGALEGTAPAVCFRTGLAAESTLFFSVLKAGGHAILSKVLYGGTIRLFREILEPFGVKASFVDTSDPSNVEAAITPETRIVFIESPGNPILTLTDIAEVAEITKRRGLLLAVDNTFLTPVLQRPLELGADISVLSTTKYIDGHNATVGGSLATNDAVLAERFRLIRKTLGSIQAPFEAWLTLQGIKTLPARLRLHCENAKVIAEWLEAHPAVARVYYPGLKSFPQHELAQRQQRAPGGMISFELCAPYNTTIAALNAVQLCSRAESLGGIETLITHPASTTHADLGPDLRAHLGISDGLIRLSVGLWNRPPTSSPILNRPSRPPVVAPTPRRPLMKFASKLIQYDAAPGDRLRPTATPIYQTATFEQEHADRFGDFDYSRSGNPTRKVLEEHVANLEGGTRGFAFASGMAAITAVARTLRAGDEILADSDLYGGTCRLFTRVLERSGIRAHYADAGNLATFAVKITPHTRLIYVESPTNPLLRVLDLRALAALAHAHNALLIVDNSLMSPYLQRPLELGADVVLHSATKFLCGHADVTGGVVIVNDAKLAEEIGFLQNAEGNALAPFDCFLLQRGIKTLKLRVDAQQRNALAIAEFLASDSRVERVFYPGLASHADHALQLSQSSGAGSVLSFTARTVEAARAVAERAKMFQICVSFGSIHSTISLPGCMSHASVPPEIAAMRELPPELVRISVGIEDADDLISDLDKALVRSVPESQVRHDTCSITASTR